MKADRDTNIRGSLCNIFFKYFWCCQNCCQPPGTQFNSLTCRYPTIAPFNSPPRFSLVPRTSCFAPWSSRLPWCSPMITPSSRFPSRPCIWMMHSGRRVWRPTASLPSPTPLPNAKNPAAWIILCALPTSCMAGRKLISRPLAIPSTTPTLTKFWKAPPTRWPCSPIRKCPPIWTNSSPCSPPPRNRMVISTPPAPSTRRIRTIGPAPRVG